MFFFFDDELKNNFENEDLLSEHYILYVDVLGYKEKINKDDNSSFLKSMLNIIDYVLKKCEISNIKTKTFSDNFIFAIPILKDETKNYTNLSKLIMLCVLLQERFLRLEKIIFRGAITKGMLYINKNIVFGKGLVDAYLLEENAAIYPRVIIDSKIANEKYIQKARQKIVRDYSRDGALFVNFMYRYGSSFTFLSSELTNKIKEKYDKIYQNVLSLYDDVKDEKTLYKINWLRNFVYSYKDTVYGATTKLQNE